MRVVIAFISALVLLLIAGIAYIYSGLFDVAASSPHSASERWILNTTMTRCIAARVAYVGEPPQFTGDRVRDGFAQYDDMCTVCHAGPGIEQSEISKGLNPPAPDLSKAVKDWTPRELFWIRTGSCRKSDYLR